MLVCGVWCVGVWVCGVSHLDHQHDLHVVQTVQTQVIYEVGLGLQLVVINLVKQVEDEHHSAIGKSIFGIKVHDRYLSWIYWRLRGSAPL